MPNYNTKLTNYSDWWLFFLTMLLCLIGLFTLNSAILATNVLEKGVLFKKQLVWYIIGTIVTTSNFLIDYRLLRRFIYPIYVVTILLLILVLLFGKSAGGAKRWLDLGLLSLQPSEMAKIVIVVIIANFYSETAKKGGLTITNLIKPFIFTMVPFFLIMKQPDLGTAMVVVLVVFSMTIFTKLKKTTLLFMIFCCGISMPLFWFFLRDYQKNRILIFLDPSRDPLGAGYHIIQSKIAIGSGMLFGKGFMQGTQNILSFLPEQHTDFIFSVIAEEWGFIGTFTVLSIFLIIIIRGIIIAGRCRDSFGTILSVGITSIIAWHVFINIGMVTGLVPVVGVALPFISYGGSSIITMMLCVGILLNVSTKGNYILVSKLKY